MDKQQTQQPVPRDVLVAAMQEALDECLDHLDDPKFAIDLSTIADRYASQVQPEPVNQQMLAALKLGKNSLLAFKLIPGQRNAWEEHDEANLVAINAAIAAAEAAQSDHIGDTDKMVNAVPVAIDRATIRQIFMAHGFTIKDGQTDLKPYVYEAAEALMRAQQPASAQPVAVPYASLRSRVADLIHLLQFFGMDAVSDADKSQALSAMDDIRAMLSAAQKQEGGE